MKWRPIRCTLAGVVGLLLQATSGSPGAQERYVDLSIGSVSHLLDPTRPLIGLPDAMVRFCPIRKDGLDDQIHYFPFTTITYPFSGLFRLMPAEGLPTSAAWDQPAPFDQEQASPSYYRTRLDGSLIQVEFTPAERAGIFRFSFPHGHPVVLIGNQFEGELTPVSSNAFAGVEHFNGMDAFVYGEFSEPVRFASRTDSGKARLAVSVSASAPSSVELRYALSYCSTNQARVNFLRELADASFEKVRRRAQERWRTALGQIQVEGGTLAQKRVFYTALYRCHLHMVNLSEDGMYYSPFDHQIHHDARPFYTDNCLWDTYRALEPLQILLQPDVAADKIQSYVRMYEQSGWMPSYAVLWGDLPCMTGKPASAWMADAWFKGVHHFDLETAFGGLRKNSLEATLLPWRNGPKCSLDDFYNEHGYYPALHPGEKETVARVNLSEERQAISVTMDQSYDDWCLAQLARVLNRPSDYQLFLKRAENYKNVFRREMTNVWPKDAEGNWIEPYDPGFSGGRGGRAYTSEMNGYIFNWDVQHDFDGLARLMGGYSAAEAKLDTLFRGDLSRSKAAFLAVFTDSTGLVGQFSIGDQPGFAIPYLYNHVGAPWKTQKRVRQLVDYWFTDTPLGIPGDEDNGATSAWVVFSMMGFYPVVPGVPVYELGSPVFDRVKIHLANGKTFTLVCQGNSSANKYIKSVRLNRRTQDQVWFRHSDVLKGLTLDLEMSDLPNPSLGQNPPTFPPSRLNLDPAHLQ